jgi:membrane protein implicated in regulation of membrane protease activity
VNPDRDLPPMRKGRVIACYVLLYGIYLVLSTIVIGSLGFTGAIPWSAQVAVCLPVALVAWIAGARLLRPWYRPAPKREQWTEDKL